MNEMETVAGYVPVQYIVYTVVVIVALIVIAWRVIPKIYSYFQLLHKKTNNYEELVKQIQKNTDDIKDLKSKVGNDYKQLNQIQVMTAKQQKYIEDSLEEREIILRALLGVVQGLQEVGANGPTKKAEAEIQAYLVKKAHEKGDDS